VSGLFDLVGRARGKRLVADKSPRYVRNIAILHLVRDGRDVALSVASWRKVTERGDLVARYRTWQDDPASTIALWWEREVRLGREHGHALGADRYTETSYEALVADPAGECARLCTFLGVPYDDAMVASTAERPVTPGMRDWRTQMPADDVRRFEAAAGDLLDELGYPRAFPGPGPAALDHAARMRALFSEDILARDGRFPQLWAGSVPG
jgi:hypothetical protein